MEQSEGYKSLQAKISVLEQQLSLCANANKECEESSKEVEKEIEEHFAKCMNALAERKASLLRGVAQKVKAQSMLSLSLFTSTYVLILCAEQIIEDSKAKLESSIDACKQAVKFASVVYAVDKNSAWGVLKV